MSEAYPNTDELVYWVETRELARKDYHSVVDPAIKDYRYCNVHRQDDRVTKYVYNWLSGHEDHRLFVPNILLARLFNQPSTLDVLGYYEDWNPDDALQKLHGIEGRTFNAAYIVSTNGLSINKKDYIVRNVLDPVFKHKWDTPHYWFDQYRTLESYFAELTDFNGVGKFIAGQVIADLKMFHPWCDAEDYHTFVAPGPGSMRGLNRLRDMEAKAKKYNSKDFSLHMTNVQALIQKHTGIELCAQNAQNCLCEFDKYMRLTLGEGRPKQRYNIDDSD